MKNLILSLVVLCCAQMSNAATVLTLNAEKMSVGTSKLTLERTSETPEKVKLEILVPRIFTECVEYSTRIVYGPDASCGYDTVWNWECREVCVDYRQCSSGNYNNDNCGCQQYANRCDNYPTNVMRSCNHPETYCSDYEDVNHPTTKIVRLNFKKAAPLAEGEVEKFSLEMEQRYKGGYNIDMMFKDLNDKYKVNDSEFLGFRASVKPKKNK